ncbi:MAG: glycosyltransferase family 2 protein [Rickettsiales bacterium]|nr:glycosyltransferase family 2 protein [Rickettsiales bacterium]
MTVLYSIVIPVFNEEGNIVELLHEIQRTIAPFKTYEIICVDDHSTDRTFELLNKTKDKIAHLRILQHQHRSGQSTALRTGFLHAKGKIIITLDGDGQNDPSNIPDLIVQYKREQCAINLRYTGKTK